MIYSNRFKSLVALGLVSTSVDAVTLYDGSLNSGPDSQGWTYLAIAFNATSTATNGGVVLDTATSNSDKAGYFAQYGIHPAVPVLNRAAGFHLDFSLKLDYEAHANDSRGGWSVLVVTSDKKAIELAFWENEIWAYQGGASSSLFTHGETAGFDTTAAVADYRLTITGGNYSLSANGQSLLTGAIRDYSAFSGFPDPYEMPNLIFMGDDTSSARSRSLLTKVAVSPVPAPPSLGLFLAALAMLASRRLRT